MRKDMFKVIVERPRWGSRARARNHAVDLGEQAPARESAGERARDRCKSLSENLAPLRRWLEAQVGRPWDKVYAELCAGIDRRNAVQQHILQHLAHYVAVQVIEVDGELQDASEGGRRRSLAHYWSSPMYVDPVHGLLRRNRGRDLARAQWEREHRAKPGRHADAAHRRVVSDTLQLLRLDGVWYAVDVEAIPPTPPEGSPWRDPPFDVIRRCNAWQCPAWDGERGLRSNRDLFGHAQLYAVGKRQLAKASLRRYGLRNDDA